MPRRTERALRPGVDVHVAMALPGRGEDVHLIRHREERPLPRTARAPRLRVDRRQLAGGVGTRADLRVRGGAIPRDEVLVLAIQHQLHGSVREFREARADDDLHVAAELAAEAAPHVVRDHAHVALRNLQRVGGPLACRVHGLRRHPRGQLVAVPFADPAVGFEAGVGLHLREVHPFDDVRRRLQGGVHVPLLPHGGLRDVPLLEDGGGRRPHRLLDGREMRQHLVVDLDQPERVLRDLLGDRGNRRDLLARVQDGRRFGLCGILEDDHRAHAVQFLRGGHIDARDPRVRMRRSEDARVEHAGPGDVVRVFRAALGLVRTVEATNGLAEEHALAEGRPASHGAPPSGRVPLPARGRRCRSGRCYRRAPSALLPLSASDSSRSGRPRP